MAKNRKDLMTRVSRIVAEVTPPERPVRYLDETSVIEYAKINRIYNDAKTERDKQNDSIKNQFAAGYVCPLTTPYLLVLSTSPRQMPDWEELYRQQWIKTFFKKYHKMSKAIEKADEKMAEIKEGTEVKFVSSLLVKENSAYRPPETIVEEEEVEVA